MAWAIFILLVGIFKGDFARADSRCIAENRYQLSCPVAMCDIVIPRLEILTSEIKQVVTKFGDHKCETCDPSQNWTRLSLGSLESNLKSELAKQGRTLDELSENVEKSSRNLEVLLNQAKTVENSRASGGKESNILLEFQKQEADLRKLYERVDSIDKQAEFGIAKISALESMTEERFGKLTQQYEAMSQMMKTILEKTNEIRLATQSQSQKIEERFEKQEAKFQETIDAVSDAKSEILKAKNDVSKMYSQLESSALRNMNKLELTTQEELKSSVVHLEYKLSESVDTLSQNYAGMSEPLKNLLENLVTQTNGLEHSVQNQTIQLEQHRIAELKEIEKQESSFNEISKSVSNLNKEISSTNTKLTKIYETLNITAVENLRKVKVNMQNMAQQMQNISSQCENMARNQEILERTELTLNNLTNRIPERTSKILETVSSEVNTIHDIVIVKTDKFVTSPRYLNVRMVTNLTDRFPQLTFSKSLGSKLASYKCKLHCEESNSCKALNIIEKEDSFVCELLPDNLCLNQTRNALLNWPGSTLWEKISTSTGQSCLDERFPPGKPISCETVRPGCFRNWPDCSNCFKTCQDSYRVYAYVIRWNYYNITLWPEGDGPFKTPIFGQCYGSWTILLRRKVNLDTAALTENYVMSFADMHRITRLGVYTRISFFFWDTSDKRHYADYMNPNIGADGTLSGITFKGSEFMTDIFKLNGQPLKPTPFVTVTDDRYGCGSFWLIDPSNATYCPGGQVRMLGQVKRENGRVITGMSFPESVSRKETIYGVRITLEG